MPLGDDLIINLDRFYLGIIPGVSTMSTEPTTAPVVTPSIVESRTYSVVLPSRTTSTDQPRIQILPSGKYDLDSFTYASTLDDLVALRALLDTAIAAADLATRPITPA